MQTTVRGSCSTTFKREVSAVVFNETLLPEFVHEEIEP